MTSFGLSPRDADGLSNIHASFETRPGVSVTSRHIFSFQSSTVGVLENGRGYLKVDARRHASIRFALSIVLDDAS